MSSRTAVLLSSLALLLLGLVHAVVLAQHGTGDPIIPFGAAIGVVIPNRLCETTATSCPSGYDPELPGDCTWTQGGTYKLCVSNPPHDCEHFVEACSGINLNTQQICKINTCALF